MSWEQTLNDSYVIYNRERAAGASEEDALYVVLRMQETAGGWDSYPASHEGEAGRIIPASSLPTAGMEQGRLAGPISQTSPGSTPGPATKLALVAQMEERPARNGMVAGSMPAEGHIQAEADATRSDAATSTDTGTGTSVVIGSPSRVSGSMPVPVSPRVAGPSEWGYRGHLAQVAKHGERKVAAWLRKGGRPKDPSYTEIMAATTGNRARAGKRQ